MSLTENVKESKTFLEADLYIVVAIQKNYSFAVEKVVLTAMQNSQNEDVVEKSIGVLGRWQIFVVLIACLVKIPIAWVQLSIVFIAPPTDFTCSNNATICSTNCSSFEYDRSIFSSSIITEWDLVCDRAYLANLAQTNTMLGILIGNFLFGQLSDKFGRRKPILIGVILQVVCGISISFINNFFIFLILRFITAVATGGIMVTSFVLVMEIVGAKWRTLFGIIYQIPFNFGHLILPLFAYYIRNWRIFHIAISLPPIILLSYYWLLPESPRWLLTVGKTENATKILQKAAKFNKLPTDKIKETVANYSNDRKKKEKNGSFFDLMRTPILRTYTLCIGFNWLSSGLCFFGGAQYIGQLGGNIFINVALSALIQIPGTFFALWSLKTLGRKYTLIFSNIVSSVSCLLIGLFPTYPWLRTVFSSIDMFGLAVTFPTVYIYSGELFPTVIRNIGVGTSSMFARIGSMIAPFIAGLVILEEWLPLAVFAITPLIGALLCLKLPETLDCKLPDSVEEAEKLGKKNNSK